jgi:uncharacterized membrane protein YjjB (DUF3815 family)
MLHDTVVLLFAITAGFTASGIVANVYRLFARDSREKRPAKIFYYVSMIFAGPSVLFENAAKALREKNSSRLAFWLATAICGYWSLALGLLLIEVGLSLQHG